MTQDTISARELAQKIDHTLLKPVLTESDLITHCREADSAEFKTVCIPPAWVKTASGLLKNSKVKVITVIGFPLGYSRTSVKAFEAKLAIEEGASEIDMVINLSFLKSKLFQEMGEDIRAVKIACGPVPLKVILETALLSDDEKIEAAKIAERAGADFIKTSTGFNGGATLADLVLLRKNLKPKTQIKASGGIKDFETARAMIAAGADRIGTSAGVSILQGTVAQTDY